MNFLQSVEKIITSHIADSNETINVAVSGGADSVALLRTLHMLNRNCIAIHINHKLRGKDSDDDQQFVADLANELNIPFICHTYDTSILAKEKKISIEMAGRYIRHDVFSNLESKWIALGHHSHDQAENFLMSMINGGSLDGLSGMSDLQKFEKFNIIRPFLNKTRLEIFDWLQSNNWKWREDKSNYDISFLRNRIRHKLLPIIEKEFNAEFVKTINKSMLILKDDNHYLNSITNNHNDTSIKVAPFNIQQRYVRNWLHSFHINRVCFDTIKKIAQLLNKTEGTKVFDLNNKYGVAVEYGNLRLINKYEKKNLPKWKLEINDDTGWVKDNSCSIGSLPANASFCAKKINRKKLKVRNVLPGDRFKPLGMKGSKKIQDIFVDKKIPKLERSSVPIVLNENDVIWIPGYCIAEGFEVRNCNDPSINLKLTAI